MLFRLLLIFVCLTTLSPVLGQYSIIADASRLKIKTPDLAERKTLKIKLDNGLEAILISDPKADQSAAVLTVKAGYWQDPEEYPGLAHFLEHMLFLGTKQYPVEDEYSRFITEHGGKNNAYTNADYTAYMFSIENKAFPEALDRFSSFFKDPLFNPSGVQREMNAVNQEYVISQDNEDTRTGYVVKEIANPKHPYSNFNIGNLETLSKVTQDVLKDWYEKHYSANLMRLMVITPTPLEQLVPYIEQDFGGIANKNLPDYENSNVIFPEDERGKLLVFHPKKNISTISMMWELPERFAQMADSKPDQLLSHILGHEGKESLISELKRENLAETLAGGCYRLSDSKMMMNITIGLTPEGIEKRNLVIERVYQTLALLKEKGVPEYFYNEIQKMDQLGYEFQTRNESFATVMAAASKLAYEDIDTYPEYGTVIQRFDPEAVQDLLKQLTPAKAVYILTTPADLPGIKLDKTDPWLNIPHAIVQIPQQNLTAWNDVQPHPEIAMPPPNPFIPAHAEVIGPKEHSKEDSPIIAPSVLVDDPLGKIYFAPNTPYGTPEVYWNLEIRTSQIHPGNTAEMVMGDLYAKALSENLRDVAYNAALAGLSMEVERTDFGIKITIQGYADKADLLWKDIVNGIKNFQITEDQFNTYKDTETRNYQNFAQEKPYFQATEMIYKVIYKDFTTTAQKAAMAPKITFERFKLFSNKLWQKTFMQGLLYGQMQESQGKEIWSTWTSSIQTAPYPAGKLAHLKVIDLNGDKGPYFFEKKAPAQGNALALGIENSTFSVKDFAAEQILTQALNQAFFSELRTKQQTGYAVFVFPEVLEKHLWTFFLEQSGTHDNRDLLARFELFNENYVQTISEEIPKERFEIIREALLTQLKKPPRSTTDMGALLNKLAFGYDGDFEWVQKRIQGYNELTYGQFIKYAEQHLGRTNKRRLAVFVNGKIPKESHFQYQKLASSVPLRKVNNFSSGLTVESK